MKTADSRAQHGPGVLPLQATHKRWKPDTRPSLLAYRIVDRLDSTDQLGHFVYDEKTVGDVVCALNWAPASRSISGWSWAWPAILDGGTATVGGGGKTLSKTPGIGIDLNVLNSTGGLIGTVQPSGSGGKNVGIDIGVLNSTGGLVGQPQSVVKDLPSTPTPGGGGNSCGSMPIGAHKMLPVFDGSYSVDGRYAPVAPAIPYVQGAYPKLPVGTYGIAPAGTDEYKEHALFFPCDPRMYSVNIAGDPEMGSLVCDLDGSFRVDKQRTARLQSAFRIIKKPLGGANAVGIQITESGCADAPGGYFVGRSIEGGGPGESASVGTGKGRTIARPSREHAGAFDVGGAKDKHQIGVDADGNPINPLHVSTSAYFRMNDAFDGPLRFEVPYNEGEDRDHPVPVHLGWTGLDWAWWTTSDWTPIDGG